MKQEKMILSGYVLDSNNDGINGASVKSYRSKQRIQFEEQDLKNKVVVQETIRKGEQDGWYSLLYESDGKPLDLVIYDHSKQHLRLLVPLCGSMSHTVNPVLLKVNQSLTSSQLRTQIRTYEYAVEYLLEGALDWCRSEANDLGERFVLPHEDLLSFAESTLPKLNSLREQIDSDPDIPSSLLNKLNRLRIVCDQIVSQTNGGASADQNLYCNMLCLLE